MVPELSKLPPIKRVVMKNKAVPLKQKASIEDSVKSPTLTTNSPTTTTTNTTPNKVSNTTIYSNPSTSSNATTKVTTKSSTDKNEVQNKSSSKMGSNINKDEGPMSTPKKTLLKKPVKKVDMLQKHNLEIDQGNNKYMLKSMKYNNMLNQGSEKPLLQHGTNSNNKNNLLNKITIKNTGNSDTNINKISNKIKVNNDNENEDSENYISAPKRYNFNLNKTDDIIKSMEPQSFVNDKIKYNPQIKNSENNLSTPSTKKFSTIFKNENNNSSKSLMTNLNNQVHSTDAVINGGDLVNNILLKKQNLVQKSEEIKSKKKQNMEELAQENNKVIRRIKTKEIIEYECTFDMDAPPLLCENAYEIKPLPPIGIKMDKIRSLLNNNKNQMTPLLKKWIENDKSCSALFQKNMESFIEEQNSILEELKKIKIISANFETSESAMNSLKSETPEKSSNNNDNA